MEKKILVTVGDCVYSKQAVKYVARISSAAKDVTYTLHATSGSQNLYCGGRNRS